MLPSTSNVELRTSNTLEAWDEFWPVLEEELERLPEKYRLPIILCHLEGRSYEETARELRCDAVRTKGMLQRGRELLRDRLVRRGVTLSVAVLGAALSRNATAAMPEGLAASTAKTTVVGVKTGALGMGSTATVAMAREILRNMMWKNLAWTAVATLFTFILTGVATMALVRAYRQFPVRSEHETAQAVDPLPVKRLLRSDHEEPTYESKPARFSSSVEEYTRRFKEALNIPEDKDRWQAWRNLGIELSDEDFAVAEAKVEEGKSQRDWEAAQEVWTRLLRKEGKSEEEIAELKSQPEGQKRLSEIRDLLDHKDAYHIVPAHDIAHAAIISHWVEKDPSAAVGFAWQVASLPDWGEGALPQVYEISVDESGQLLRKLRIMPYNSNAYFLRGILFQWGLRDLDASVRWVQQLPKDKESRERTNAALGGVILSASLVDPQLITGLLDEPKEAGRNHPNIPMDLFQTGSIHALATSLCAKDPMRGLEWAEKLYVVLGHEKAALGPGVIWESALRVVVRHWAKQDIGAARKWAEGLPAGDPRREEALPKIVELWAESDPQAAVKWIEKLPPGDERAELSKKVVIHQVEDATEHAANLQELLQTIQTLPGEYEEEAVSHVALYWKKLEEVLEWLRTQDPAESRDMAIYHVVWRMRGAVKNREISFPDLLEVAGKYTIESERYDLLEQVVHDWAKTDRSAAEKWIRDSPLPAEIKERLRKAAD